VIARNFGGKALWDEMKENALGATREAMGAARLVADRLAALVEAGEVDEVHLVGHSAGSIFHAPLAQHLCNAGVSISSLSLWAPACTMELFDTTYRPLIEAGKIEAFDLYLMDDVTEQNDDCVNIYHKSLLYMVSNAFEEAPRIRGSARRGTALLGLDRDVSQALPDFWMPGTRCKYLAPGPQSAALHHGDFDNDRMTLRSTLHRITGASQQVAAFPGKSSQRLADRGARSQIRRDLNLGLR
jgi:pimeloyl-ACP methyl ester carboxylesterase